MRSGVSVLMKDAKVDRYKGRADSLERRFLPRSYVTQFYRHVEITT